MSRHRHRSHYQGESGGLLGGLFTSLFLLLILGAVGGVTWLALTPMEAPTKEVVRAVPSDKLGPT